MGELRNKQFEAKIKGLEEESAEKERLIEELRQTIALREEEVKASDDKIAHLERTERDLRREIREGLTR